MILLRMHIYIYAGHIIIQTITSINTGPNLCQQLEFLILSDYRKLIAYKEQIDSQIRLYPKADNSILY